MGEAKMNRLYKDHLFSIIFGRAENRKWTLELYNAINRSCYENADDIEFTTIESALYMGMRNDVSFLLQMELCLYEHQTTINPNMPVRDLMYLGQMYDKYIEQRKLNLFGEKQIFLPVPRLVTLYNGPTDEEDRILRLSDAFKEGKEKSDVEVQVRMININPGHNESLMEACEPLKEYAWFVDEVRKKRKVMTLEKAADETIDEMPEEFVLRKFLVGHRGEVKMSVLFYDEEKIRELFRNDGLEEGLKKGKEERQALEEENRKLKEEIEQLKTMIKT